MSKVGALKWVLKLNFNKKIIANIFAIVSAKNSDSTRHIPIYEGVISGSIKLKTILGITDDLMLVKEIYKTCVDSFSRIFEKHERIEQWFSTFLAYKLFLS